MKEKTSKVDRRLYKPYALNLIASFLEKRASQGWILTNFDNYNAGFGLKGLKFTFSKGEPQQLRFAVELFDPGLSSSKDLPAVTQEYADYCEAAGWHFIDSVEKIHIFCTEDLDADPVETDQELKLSTIHKIMFRQIKVNLLFCLVCIVILILAFSFGVTFMLSNMINSLNLAPLFFFAVVWLLDAFRYLIWFRKARRLVDQGEKVPFARDSQIFIYPILLTYFYVCAFLLSASMFPLAQSAYILQVMTIALGFLVCANILLVFIAAKGAGHLARVLSIFVYLAVIVFIFSFAWTRSNFGYLGSAEKSDMPIMLSDLNIKTTGQSSYTKGSDYPFLVREVVYFESNTIVGGGAGLFCTVIETKLKFLVPVILQQQFLDNILRHQNFQKITADNYKADEVYEEQPASSMPNYLFVFADKIVSVSPTWVLTSDQIQIIDDKLSVSAE